MKSILILSLSLCIFFGPLYGTDIEWNTLPSLPRPSHDENGSFIIYVAENPTVALPHAVYYLVYDEQSTVNRFYRFLINALPQRWEELAYLPGDRIGQGADISVQYDSRGYPLSIYAIKGNFEYELWSYDLYGNYWSSGPIDILPYYSGLGSRFVYGGTFIDPEGYRRARYYFLVAHWTQEFWVWCPCVRHGYGVRVRDIYPPPYWEQKEQIPSIANKGSALTYAQCDNVPEVRAMYAFDRASNQGDYFWRYTIATDAWEPMDKPWNQVYNGASLQSYYFPPYDNLLIGFKGENQHDHCEAYWTNSDNWFDVRDPEVPSIDYGSDMTFGRYADGNAAVYAIFGGYSTSQSDFKWGRVVGEEPGGGQTTITSPINETELRILPKIANIKTGVTLLISPDVKELSIYYNSGIRIKSLKCNNRTEFFWKPKSSGVFFIYAETRDKILKGKLVVTP